LNDVNEKEKVYITNEGNDDNMCKRFVTDGNECTVKFYVN
jgi:hypothetical protein